VLIVVVKINLKNFIMKIKFFCTFFVILSGLIACNKKNEQAAQPTASLGDLIKTVKTDGNVVITSTSYSFSKNPVTQVDIEATLRDAQASPIKFEQASVSDIELKAIGTSYQKNFNVITNQSDMARITENLFGKNLDVTLKSTQYGDVKTTILTPTVLKMELSNDKTGVINVADGLTIRWNPNNGFERTANQVGVLVQYHAGFLSNQATNLPRNNLSVYKVANDSEGQVQFSPQELATLPRGGTVVVYSGRGQQVINTNDRGHSTAVTVLSHSSSSELVVQ
jgi:hypothetical protein